MNDYDFNDDFRKSIEVCYEELRKRPGKTWPAVLGKRDMNLRYTMSEPLEGVTFVRAELKTPDDFNELIKKLFERRDRDYPQQKEESK